MEDDMQKMLRLVGITEATAMDYVNTAESKKTKSEMKDAAQNLNNATLLFYAACKKMDKQP